MTVTGPVHPLPKLRKPDGDLVEVGRRLDD